MKNNYADKFFYLFLLVLLFTVMCGYSNAYAKESVLYGGGPLYNNAATHRDMIRASGFTTILLWTIHVRSDGDLVFNNIKIVDDGVYIGRSAWPDELRAFKEGQTSVRRIEIAIGAWGSAAFANIRDLINTQGTGPGSILYKNFKLLKNAVPAIDGISYDDETTYDVDSSVRLAVMLNDLGYKVTLCPYTRSSYWSSVFSQTNDQRPNAIDRVDLQCYAGGSYNNPGTWNNYFGGLHVTPGLWCYSSGQTPAEVQTRMESWNASYNIAGGFMWLLDDMLKETYPVADYGWAINNALQIDLSEVFVTTLYQNCSYKGWTADMGVGAYTAADIITAGGYNNDTSSVQVAPGYQITFYDEDNFQGAALVKRADVSCLVDDSWNDRVSSLIIEPIQEPVGHWKFNEKQGSVVYDESEYQFDGTLNNMNSASWTLGKQCGGLAFDGVNDYVEIPGYRGVVGSASRTCTAWIKTNSSNNYRVVTSWGASANGQAWMFCMNPNGKMTVSLFGAFVTGTLSINDNNWHHVAAVLKDDINGDGRVWVEDIQIYIDGVMDVISSINTGSDPSVQISTSADMNVTVGVRNYGKFRPDLGYSYYFNGLIDEVRIYNRALSVAEIQDIYQEYALLGDFDDNGFVNLGDFAILSAEWQNADNCDVDLTCDCRVDIDDLTILIERWLSSTIN